MKLTIFLLVALVAGCSADLYLANPRGSNNRLNEANAQRTNNNRMFDSQNNGRGGYNVCDKDDATAAADNAASLRRAPDNIYNGNINDDGNAATGSNVQYPMMYYEGSRIEMEWTVQHGCGGNEATDPNKLNCNMVVQYACDQDHYPTGAEYKDVALSTNLADGTNTDAPATVGCAAAGNKAGAVAAAETASDAAGNGRHESQGWYCECEARSQNKGLFVSDQNLQGTQAIYTRQNAGGGASGLECSEERDYYPYWVPTPWRDMAYLTDDLSRCEMVQTESQNVKNKFKCTGYSNGAQDLNQATTEPITEQECLAAAGGKWMEYKSYYDPASANAKPECLLGQYSRPNSLGNGRGDGISPTTVGYNATLPTFAALTDPAWNGNNVGAQVKVVDQQYIKCVMRLRYNVSTDDYDPWTINASANGDKTDNALAPIKDGNINIGSTNQVDITVNTNQFGRTFQDRSHTFWLRKLSDDLVAATTAGATIHNLGVRGKRCNIVQCYPAVEYDFAPTNLNIAQNDIVHMQWCGSLTHNNGGDGGDGEAGDAGEGAGGTDKYNLLQMKHFGDNYPVPMDKMAELGVAKYFGADNLCYQANSGNKAGGLPADLALLPELDCALRVATNGYFQDAGEVATKDALDVTLDNTPAATFHGGVMITVKANVGTKYIYMQSRNNNFTNRGAKGVTTVVKGAAL